MQLGLARCHPLMRWRQLYRMTILFSIHKPTSFLGRCAPPINLHLTAFNVCAREDGCSCCNSTLSVCFSLYLYLCKCHPGAALNNFPKTVAASCLFLLPSPYGYRKRSKYLAATIISKKIVSKIYANLAGDRR